VCGLGPTMPPHVLAGGDKYSREVSSNHERRGLGDPPAGNRRASPREGATGNGTGLKAAEGSRSRIFWLAVSRDARLRLSARESPWKQHPALVVFQGTACQNSSGCGPGNLAPRGPFDRPVPRSPQRAASPRADACSCVSRPWTAGRWARCSPTGVAKRGASAARKPLGGKPAGGGAGKEKRGSARFGSLPRRAGRSASGMAYTIHIPHTADPRTAKRTTVAAFLRFFDPVTCSSSKETPRTTWKRVADRVRRRRFWCASRGTGSNAAVRRAEGGGQRPRS